MENPNIMIPFFVTICGFSERELERLYGIRNVYGLGEHAKRKAEELANAIKKYLKYPYHLETVIYKFYKNWEEHQKRHFRGRRAEELVGRILLEHGYDAGKTKVVCRGEEIEIDYAIPRSGNIQVAIMVRHGVFRDLVKRAKEFSTEFDMLMECFPGIRFIVVYLVSQHEKNRINDIRKRIEAEREGKRPYDLIILTEDELKELLPRKLEEWGVPRVRTLFS